MQSLSMAAPIRFCPRGMIGIRFFRDARWEASPMAAVSHSLPMDDTDLSCAALMH